MSIMLTIWSYYRGGKLWFSLSDGYTNTLTSAERQFSTTDRLKAVDALHAAAKAHNCEYDEVVRHSM